MIRYLKDRGAYVLFNTNGTVLTAKKGRELVAGRPGRAARFARCRRCPHVSADPGQGLLQSHRAQRARLHRDAGARGPRAAAGVALAHGPQGDHRPAPRVRSHRPRHRREGGLPAAAGVLRGHADRHGAAGSGPVRAADARRTRITCAAAETQAAALGISFNASGATEPGESLERKSDTNPWSLCRRPWAVMYFTANGRALPCCIAPFSQKGYENYTLGDATQQTLREIWNGRGYQDFREALLSGMPPKSCASCGLRWSL